MAFTTAQLAAQLAHPNLATWAASTLANQGPLLAAFDAHFAAVQTWITANGGSDPFGWDDVQGLTHVSGAPVVLSGPQQTAPFNDAFNDVRTFRPTPGFRLFQAAEAMQRLIRVLGILG